jgi:hypothetical protein
MVSSHEPPTVFHLTHWKAGSQWIRAVLTEAQPDRVVEIKEDMSHVHSDPIVPGTIYSPVYSVRHVFAECVKCDGPVRLFLVIRDLRDTLVSWYFSLRTSHPPNPGVDDMRSRLHELSREEGLIYLINERLAPMAAIQEGWLPHAGLTLRYEDFLNDQQEAFRRVFEHCEIEIPGDQRRRIVDRHTFEKYSGRKPGDEDVSAHCRKGVAGDWRNHFTDRVRTVFAERFGATLIATGYERDSGW